MPKQKFIKFITIILLLLASSLIGCGASDAGDIVLRQSVVVQETFVDTTTENVQNQEKQGTLGESESGYDEQDTQENSGTLGNESEMNTSETLVEETNDSYYFGPISYDLSKLPAMENEYYAEWDGNIYFRQYSDEDIEDGALWASFGEIHDSEKELMCLASDGELTQVGTDHGYGSMYIVGGRIYSQKYDERENGWSRRVYSCELDGSDLREYDSAEVLAVRGDKIICHGTGWGSGLTIIDAKTGEERTLTDGSEHTWEQAWYLEATEEEIYFYRIFRQERDGDADICDTVLYSVDYEGNVRELTTFTHERHSLSINCFEILGDTLYFSVGFYDGSEYVYQGGPICSIKKDGSEFKEEVFARDEYFYLYDDGMNRVLYCNPSDERGGLAKVEPIVLKGEVSEAITMRACFSPYDRPFQYANIGSLLYYPDTSGICYELLTGEEREEITGEAYVPGSFDQAIRNIEYLDDKLFFTVVNGIYNPDGNIGWREYYNRGRSACYCKDLESGEIRLLYEY